MTDIETKRLAELNKFKEARVLTADEQKEYDALTVKSEKPTV